MSSFYILALDVGTTNIKCIVYDACTSNLAECESFDAALEIIKNEYGVYEIGGDHLYDCCFSLVSKFFDKYADRIVSFGLATQRGSNLLWDKETGKCLTNFITWNDTRLKFFYQQQQSTTQLSQTESFQYTALERLKWSLNNSQESNTLHEGIKKGTVLFGTVETWIIWKLTKGKLHVVDKANISLSGMYDIEKDQWDFENLRKNSIPFNILPTIINTHGHLGDIDPSIFGYKVPINAVIGDQQASTYGCYCLKPLQAKATFGTGTFFDVNIGPKYFNFEHKSVFCYRGWQELVNIDDSSVKDGQPTFIAEIGSSGNTEIIANLFEKKIISSIKEIHFHPDEVYQIYEKRHNLSDQPKTLAIIESIEKIAFKFCKIFKIFMTTFSKFSKMESEKDISLFVNGNLTRNKLLIMIVSSLLGIPISTSDPNATARGTGLLCQSILLKKRKVELIEFDGDENELNSFDFTENMEFREVISKYFEAYLEDTKNDTRL